MTIYKMKCRLFYKEDDLTKKLLIISNYDNNFRAKKIGKNKFECEYIFPADYTESNAIDYLEYVFSGFFTQFSIANIKKAA